MVDSEFRYQNFRSPLSWSQHWTWVANSEGTTERLVLDLTVAIPEGIDLGGVRKVLAACFRRHEALRATFHIGPDGNPYQIIHPPRVPDVRIIDSPEERRRCSDVAFDLEKEFPVRVDLLAPLGKPSALHLLIHHIAMDWAAHSVLEREIKLDLQKISTGQQLAVSPSKWSPRQQAGVETSEVGTRGNEAALRHWREIHEIQRRDLVPPRTTKMAGAGYEATMVSREVAQLCYSIAQEHKCFPSAVMMSAIAASIANSKGRDKCLLSPVLSNRTSVDARNAVCTLTGRGWALMDFRADPSFEALLQQAMDQLLNAMRHASFRDSTYVMELVAAGCAGGDDGAALFNFVTHEEPEDVSSHADGQVQIVGHAEPRQEIQIAGNRDAFSITFWGGSSFLEPDECRQLLMGLPALLRQVKGFPETPHSKLHGVIPAWKPPSEAWVDIHGAWINVHEVQSVLEKCPGVKKVALFPAKPGGVKGEALTVCATVAPSVTLHEVRDYFTEHVLPDTSPVLPDWFVLSEKAPADPSSLEEWCRLPLLAQGNGRGDTEHDAKEGVELSLLQEFQRYHHRRWKTNMDLSYAENGGEYIKIPAVIQSLSLGGLRGLTVGDFMSLRSLRSLARQLT